jgi:hypothetical protein
MIYFIAWYLIGVISFIACEWFHDDMITLEGVFYSLILGLGGLLTTVWMITIMTECKHKKIILFERKKQ